MSARRKKGSPMKYRGFYCTDELYLEMQSIAEKLNESDAEYIRKAVEQRNAQYKQIKEGDKVKNKETGEEYTVVKVREDDGVIVAENKKEKRAFGDKLTYNKSDLEKCQTYFKSK